MSRDPLFAVSQPSRGESAIAPQRASSHTDPSRRAVRATALDSYAASVVMASAARVARAAPNQIAPSAGSGTGSGGPGPGPGPGPAAIPAAVPQAVPALPAAEAIGSEFVAQYYAAMHARLDQLHRFYAEDSSLFVAGAPSSVAATGLRAIDDALRRLAARRARVTVTSVDALHSAHGAVVVVVTGRAEGIVENDEIDPGVARRFTQTFVLAPQRNGFYVKNDLVRFLAEPLPDAANASVAPPTPTVAPPTPTVATNGATRAAKAAVAGSTPAPVGESQSLEAVEAKLAAAARRASKPSKTNAADPDRPVEPPIDSIVKPTSAHVEPPPAGPPSYAATLLKARAAAAAENDPPASAKKEAKRVPEPGVDPGVDAPKAPAADARMPPEPSEGTNRAVFVRHFPPATTEADLRAAFAAFGAVAPDGVTLRASKTQKSETVVEKHAFVEFVDARGFASALKGAAERDILVLGAAVGVEAKREKPPARRSERERKSGAEARGGDAAARRAPRRPAGGARPRGEGDAARREGGTGRNRGRADKADKR